MPHKKDGYYLSYVFIVGGDPHLNKTMDLVEVSVLEGETSAARKEEIVQLFHKWAKKKEFNKEEMSRNICVRTYFLEQENLCFEPKRKCRVCGCTDNDCHKCIEKTGHPCHWIADDLCSACAPKHSKKKSRRELSSLIGD